MVAMDMSENPLEMLRQAANLKRDIEARYDAAMAQVVAQGLAPADVATAAGITYSAATKAMRKVRSAADPFPEPPVGAKFGWAKVTLRSGEVVQFGSDFVEYEILPDGSLKVVCVNGAESVWNAAVWDRYDRPVDPEYR